MPLDNIDSCVEKYIKSNIKKLKTGNDAQKEFDEVEETLNVDNAFTFKVKKFGEVPALYMYSSKSNTLLQVYFGIKEEAGHIELSVKELIDKYKSNNKEDSSMDTNTMIENAILLSRARALIEAACEGCEDLEEVKDSLEDAVKKIDDVIDGCGCEDKKEKKDDDKVSEKTKEVVNEAVYRLYEKAALIESIEEATPYLEKAEQLLEAISDIPEEKPVEDDEYPEDVVGGEGISDDEDIKDLLGGDSEALAILKDDDGSTIVDA